jgi:hypothetical protein
MTDEIIVNTWPKTPAELAKSERIGRDKVMRWINNGRLEADNVADETSQLPRYLIHRNQWETCRANLLSPAAARRRLQLAKQTSQSRR